MSEGTLSVLDGSTFVVSDRLGDVRADEGREHGFFSDDTRFISRWVLRVGTDPLVLISLDQGTHFDARFLPVAFPTASRPQAWSAGAPLLLLTTLLNLEPGDSEAHADIASDVGHVVLHRPAPQSTADMTLGVAT